MTVPLPPAKDQTMRTKSRKLDTLLAHAGRDPEKNFGIVNPPVYHASTVLYPNVAAYESAGRRRFDRGAVTYGRHGTPTTFALEEAVAAVEGGARAIVFCSGAAACFTSLLAFVKAGDHVLVTDSVYGPVRAFSTGFLERFGVATTFYDPRIGGAIERLIRPETRVLYMESPGSLTFEVQDVPVLISAARAKGVRTVIDNTWAAPLFFKPMTLGVDVEVISATKYIVGHSDAMMGIAVTTDESFLPVRTAAAQLGYHAAPDDCYLALRGLRSAGVRLKQHEAQGLALARYLSRRPEVERVLHPGLPSSEDHALWRRDFSGSSGLFSLVLKSGIDASAIAAMLDGMELFGMGASWGGFESLILPAHPERLRTAVPWRGGPVLRLHVGLEDIDDLIADLERGFERMQAL
jgi:cysteine-S-conjugate beta-lyase